MAQEKAKVVKGPGPGGPRGPRGGGLRGIKKPKNTGAIVKRLMG